MQSLRAYLHELLKACVLPTGDAQTHYASARALGQPCGRQRPEVRLDGGGAEPEVACSRTAVEQNSIFLGYLTLAGEYVAVERQPGSANTGSLQAADAWLW